MMILTSSRWANVVIEDDGRNKVPHVYLLIGINRLSNVRQISPIEESRAF